MKTFLPESSENHVLGRCEPSVSESVAASLLCAESVAFPSPLTSKPPLTTSFDRLSTISTANPIKPSKLSKLVDVDDVAEKHGHNHFAEGYNR